MSFLATDITNLVDVESKLVAADTTVAKTLLPMQVAPVTLSGLLFSNNDAIDHHVQVILTRGGVSAVVGALTVPIGTGTGGSSPSSYQSGLFGLLPNTPSYAAGAELSWRVEEAVTSTFEVTAQLTIGSY